MTRRTYINLAFQVILIILLALATWDAHGWTRDTRLFPYAVSRVALLLTIILFISDVLKTYFKRKELLAEDRVEEDKESALTGVDAAFIARAAREFAWILGFGGAIGCLGFYPAVFLFLLGYFKARAKMSVFASLIWAVAATGIVYLMFYKVLSVPIYFGLIGRLW